MNIGRLPEGPECRAPRDTSLVFEGRSLDRATLDRRSGAVAAGLAALGVGTGDRVVLSLPNVPEFIEGYLGTVRLGAIAVSANPRLTAEELAFVVRDCGAKVVLTLRPEAVAAGIGGRPDPPVVVGLGDGWPAPAIATHPVVDVPPDHPAAIVYTSGTTGHPMGATLSHANVLFNSLSKRSHLGIHPDDRLLLFLPLFHCFGQNAVLNAALQAGAAIVLHRAFDPGEVLRSIVNDGVTMVFAVPPVFRILLDAADPGAFPGVRLFFSAASPLPRPVEDGWLSKFGRPINQGYGLTETSPFASYNHRDRYRPGSIGTPIEGVAMKVVSCETGAELAAGEVGEIAIRGPNEMLGYWGRAEATCEAIRDGWFHTGDIGTRDEEGYFYLLDRVKDMINTGGLKAYPAEIEGVLGRHPCVAEAAVFGIPDELLGEVVAARVVTTPGARVTASELVAHCRGSLAPNKVPGQIEFAESLPRGPTGKVLKRVLRGEKLAPPADLSICPGVVASGFPTGRPKAGDLGRRSG